MQIGNDLEAEEATANKLVGTEVRELVANGDALSRSHQLSCLPLSYDRVPSNLPSPLHQFARQASNLHLRVPTVR